VDKCCKVTPSVLSPGSQFPLHWIRRIHWHVFLVSLEWREHRILPLCFLHFFAAHGQINPHCMPGTMKDWDRTWVARGAAWKCCWCHCNQSGALTVVCAWGLGRSTSYWSCLSGASPVALDDHDLRWLQWVSCPNAIPPVYATPFKPLEHVHRKFQHW